MLTAINLIRKSGSIEKSRQLAEVYTRRALKETAGLSPGTTRDILSAMAEELLVRRT
ncbi:hypothetical protein [Marispirochaeta sp.]|uniref:hypothetical protein n=1 Tax=Marispirochaeta sp. TaxID=2038653 RepID=UPI0029C8BB37|nr:hypothetical protein [Marispirochaeta sp.]